MRRTDQDTAVIGGMVCCSQFPWEGVTPRHTGPQGDPWSQPGGLLGKNIYCSSFRNCVGKESTCNAGDPSSIPGLGRSSGEGIGTPPVFLGFPGGSAGKESACNLGDLHSIPGMGRSPGEGKGYPLQYSGLENSMDFIVDGVAKSHTQLSNFHFQERKEVK